MKRMICINVDPLYAQWGYKKGEIYDVDDQYTDENPNHYRIDITRSRGGRGQPFWFPRVDFDVPDVPTCMKCGMTDPPSDEDTHKEPCANDAHEWLGDR